MPPHPPHSHSVHATSVNIDVGRRMLCWFCGCFSSDVQDAAPLAGEPEAAPLLRVSAVSPSTFSQHFKWEMCEWCSEIWKCDYHTSCRSPPWGDEAPRSVWTSTLCGAWIHPRILSSARFISEQAASSSNTCSVGRASDGVLLLV